MGWEVATTDEFDAWFSNVDRPMQLDIAAAVELLGEFGPRLGRPHVDTVHGSRFPNLKELRIQSKGRPVRIFFAFDPRRSAILLIGADKTGRKAFYDKMIAVAESLFAKHLAQLEREEHDG